jgi:hypothetical protein
MTKPRAFCLTILPLSLLTWCLLIGSDRYLAIADLLKSSDPSLVAAKGNSPDSAGDAPIDNSALITPLLGHWITADGMTDYYLGRDHLIEINLLPSQERSPILHKQKLSYQVLAPQTDNLIRLQIQTPLGWVQVRRLHLNGDRRTLVETIDMMGHSFINQWIYVDDRQQP